MGISPHVVIHTKKRISEDFCIDSVSYAIGISTGAGYKENLKTLPGDPANVDDLIAGFIQAIKGDSSAMKMTRNRLHRLMLQTYFMEASARDAKKTKEEGEKFLAENKRRKTLSRLRAACNIR